jgi:2-dehydro-3-deoxyphosphogalactonate aldolase
MVGGGTVMTPDHARRVVGSGGTLVVMPHSDIDVVRAAKAAGAVCVPGIATPTEGFAAIGAGADALKLFPAEMLPPAALKALTAVFPPRFPLIPVGGITPETMAGYVAAGAAGFGIGSALYKPGIGVEEIAKRAKAFVVAWRAIRHAGKT